MSGARAPDRPLVASPVLQTKFFLPSPRPGVVVRPRLHEHLRRGAATTLTLISAPAGFGKTTLLAEWLAATRSDRGYVAWLSLDADDSDPASFWTYVVAALQTADAGLGASTRELLLSAGSSIETALGMLLNELSGLADDVLLVLDDYHVIRGPAVHEQLAYFLQHLPPRAHVMISTRVDPPLPLARMRVRGDLVEVRAADLRFLPDEVAAYLAGVLGRDLAAADIAALSERTEGWAAALQLAALSMRGRDDTAAFVAGFAGDDRYVVDYLVEEVLQQQDEGVRDFLLGTCLLDRLTPPLCDAVTGRADSKAMLDALDRENLFVVALDEQRRWYRYHHLFAEMLQARLLDEQPERVAVLQQRASEWYGLRGHHFRAVRHALAAEDVELAAEHMERAVPDLRRRRQEGVLKEWLDLVPDEVTRVRPVLNAGFVGALAAFGELDDVERRLNEIQTCLDAVPGGPVVPVVPVVVVDTAQLRCLPGTIQMYRAALAQTRGDADGTVRHARAALDLSPADDHLTRAGAAGFLAITSWTGGRLDDARAAWTTAASGLQLAGHLSDVLGCSIAQADIAVAQGRLRAAAQVYRRALQRAAEYSGPPPRGTPDMHVGLAALHLERDELAAADEQLRMSDSLGKHNGLPQYPYRRRMILSRLLELRGDPDGAGQLLDEAEGLYTTDFFPDVRPLPAVRARLWIRQGRFGEAMEWARRRGLSAADEPSFLHEYEHITLARALLGRSGRADTDDLRRATGLLRRLLAAAESRDATGSVIELLVLSALAGHARGDARAAAAAVDRALGLAEPEGYIRVFVDEGQPMAALLRTAAGRGVLPTYVGKLLAKLSAADSRPDAAHALVEPLSERELHVLRLLGTDLTGPDIARELVVSQNTVRTHLKHIYAKLGVNSRRSAIRRGEELGLLAGVR